MEEDIKVFDMDEEKRNHLTFTREDLQKITNIDARTTGIEREIKGLRIEVKDVSNCIKDHIKADEAKDKKRGDECRLRHDQLNKSIWFNLGKLIGIGIGAGALFSFLIALFSYLINGR